MKTIYHSILFVAFILSAIACEDDKKTVTLENFAELAPAGWECEIIEEDYNPAEFPWSKEEPLAVVKYFNASLECSNPLSSFVGPALILDFYPITKKQELLELIKASQMFSWCIPMYFGETSHYFILTSPCFNFNGIQNDCASELQKALDTIVEKYDYGLVE